MLDEKTRYLTPREVEKVFGLTAKWLANLRFYKRGPAYLKVGSKKILYSVDDVESWLQTSARRIETQGEFSGLQEIGKISEM